MRMKTAGNDNKNVPVGLCVHSGFMVTVCCVLVFPPLSPDSDGISHPSHGFPSFSFLFSFFVIKISSLSEDHCLLLTFDQIPIQPKGNTME